MQFKKKPIATSSSATSSSATSRAIAPAPQLQRQPRAFGLGGSMIDAVKNSSKGCKSCGG